jgi:hypothetical protein
MPWRRSGWEGWSHDESRAISSTFAAGAARPVSTRSGSGAIIVEFGDIELVADDIGQLMHRLPVEVMAKTTKRKSLSSPHGDKAQTNKCWN